ncbi:MAG: sugar phosphate isomerase/epimerase [Ruminococcaceae bacterium]|nr:sugar phosphate isomerase/epimerase [Oscillospiraceae bacterium]
MTLPVGLQLYSVRDELEKDFYATIKKVKEMGYDAVELCGLGHMDPLEVRRMLDEVGLFCNSSHCPTDEMKKEGTFAKYKAAGLDYIVVPWMSYGSDHRRLKENLELIRTLAEEAKKEGLTLLYHNHDFEFEREGEETIIDTIYSTIPEDLLQTELDTCWVKFAGSDPCEYIRKYTGRSPIVHLKDFWEDANFDSCPYDLIGKTREERENEGFEFRPIGHGIQDIPAILKASIDAGAKWIIVEQDESKNRPSLESAKMSIDYLRSFEW